MELSRRYQRQVMGKDKVGYQGTEGAFSHIALRNLFGPVKEMAYATFEDVIIAVERGDVAYGVIPFENSYTGEVGEVFDLLFVHPVHICGMYDLPISQNLLGLEGASLSDIRQVYSHHQAISQSQEFLKNLGLEAIPYPNTATAAKYVKETNDKSKGAIASLETADLYGLSVLKEGINTSSQNTTRFILLCKEPAAGGNRFSLLFTVDHAAGRLAGVIGIIADFGFSLESIKSRPVKNVPWQYYFYVEIIGDPEEDRARQMLVALAKECKELKLLGSYTK
jgi:chorismate mutase/prephenate dehydratase